MYIKLFILLCQLCYLYQFMIYCNMITINCYIKIQFLISVLIFKNRLFIFNRLYIKKFRLSTIHPTPNIPPRWLRDQPDNRNQVKRCLMYKVCKIWTIYSIYLKLTIIYLFYNRIYSSVVQAYKYIHIVRFSNTYKSIVYIDTRKIS